MKTPSIDAIRRNFWISQALTSHHSTDAVKAAERGATQISSETRATKSYSRIIITPLAIMNEIDKLAAKINKLGAEAVEEKIKPLLTRLAEDVVKQENLLGEGISSYAFRIIGAGRVLRFPKRSVSMGTVTIGDERIKGISDTIEHKILKCGDVEIQHEREGVIAGIKHKSTSRAVSPKVAANYVCHGALEMAQEGFDEYARVLKELDKRGLHLDTRNPNNFIFNVAKKKIYCVDNVEAISEWHADAGTQNTITDMIKPFLTKLTVFSSAEFNPSSEIIKQRRAIFKKCIIAEEKAKLKLSVDKYMFEMDSVMDLLGLNCKWQDVAQKLLKIRESNGNLETYLDHLLA